MNSQSIGASSGEGCAILVIPGAERSDRIRLDRANASSAFRSTNALGHLSMLEDSPKSLRFQRNPLTEELTIVLRPHVCTPTDTRWSRYIEIHTHQRPPSAHQITSGRGSHHLQIAIHIEICNQRCPNTEICSVIQWNSIHLTRVKNASCIV